MKGSKYRCLTASILVSVLLFHTNLTAREAIGNDPDSLSAFYNYALSENDIDLLPIDTLVTGIQRYNPISCYNCYFITNGNTGQPHLSLIPSFPEIKGFVFGMNPIPKFLLPPDSTKFYHILKPYTRVFYVMGSKKEQNLRITHSQNVARWFNLGLEFDYVNSPGYYKRQLTDDKNFALNGHFKTGNSKYHIYINYLHNKIKIQENGGIRYDSVFTENVITSRETIAVNLSDAQNRIKENSYFIKQVYLFRNDSLTTQNTDTSSMKWSLLPTKITHSFHIDRKTWIYTNSPDDNSFYDITYDTINATYDSSLIYKIENKVTITNKLPRKTNRLDWLLGIAHQYAELSGYAPKKYFSSLIPFATITFNPGKNIGLLLKGNYTFGDHYKDDFHAKASLKLEIKDIQVEFATGITGSKGGYFFHTYSSNHFRWENDLKQQIVLEQSGSLRFKGYHVKIRHNTIKSYIYLDTSSVSSQFDGTLQTGGVYLGKIFRYRNWSANTNAGYQYSSDAEVLPLPEIIANASLYYTKNIFGSAAIIQPGLDFFYYSSFAGYGYTPALMSYYPQNTKKTGNFLYADVFLNLKIKKASLFLKYQNLGYLFGQFNYYMVPSYPMPDGGLRFGVSWMFYD